MSTTTRATAPPRPSQEHTKQAFDAIVDGHDFAAPHVVIATTRSEALRGALELAGFALRRPAKVQAPPRQRRTAARPNIDRVAALLITSLVAIIAVGIVAGSVVRPINLGSVRPSAPVAVAPVVPAFSVVAPATALARDFGVIGFTATPANPLVVPTIKVAVLHPPVAERSALTSKVAALAPARSPQAVVAPRTNPVTRTAPQVQTSRPAAPAPVARVVVAPVAAAPGGIAPAGPAAPVSPVKPASPAQPVAHAPAPPVVQPPTAQPPVANPPAPPANNFVQGTGAGNHTAPVPDQNVVGGTANHDATPNGAASVDNTLVVASD